MLKFYLYVADMLLYLGGILMKNQDERYLIQITIIGVITYILLFGTGCSGPFTNKTEIQGPQGPGIPVLTAPASPTQCPAGGTQVTIGSTVSVVCNGSNGVQGPSGSTGPQGPAGVDITPISFVQFCTGISPSYPGTFPEIGLCINHNLYGVYSQNGGFLVLLPPGAYISNGINASCNFTITADCGVQ